MTIMVRALGGDAAETDDAIMVLRTSVSGNNGPHHIGSADT